MSCVAPHITFEALMKFVPVTVSVVAGDPVTAEDGLRLLMVGADEGALMVNVEGVEVRPPVVTAIAAVPAVVSSEAGTDTEMALALV